MFWKYDQIMMNILLDIVLNVNFQIICIYICDFTH